MKHKFINKKAGAEARVIAIYLDSDGVMQVDGYDTVEDLMDDYAAYGKYEPPKEPLIKDEKIRKAVRAWAEANEYDLDKGLDYTEYVGNYGCSFATYGSDDNEIHFCKKLGLEDGRDYTIAELCGENDE